MKLLVTCDINETLRVKFSASTWIWMERLKWKKGQKKFVVIMFAIHDFILNLVISFDYD